MNKKIQILLLILVFAICSKAQSLDQILQKHYQAVGIKYLREVESIRYDGYYVNHYLKKSNDDVRPEFFNPKFKITVEKRNNYLLQIFDNRREIKYAFNKEKYWKQFYGSLPIEWVPSNIDRKRIQQYLDTEGFLFNWKKKGHSVTKLDDINYKNKNYNRIMLVTPENDTLYYYLNPKTYLLSKLSFGGDISTGKEFPTYTFQKYKSIEGVKFSYKIIYRLRTLDGTFDESEMIITKIIINPKFNNNIFTLNHRIKNIKESK
jgi:hypothetical protein